MAGGAEAILMTAYSGHGQAREELPTLVCKHLQTHSESRLPISFHLSVKGEARERAGQPLKWPSVLIYCIWGLSGFAEKRRRRMIVDLCYIKRNDVCVRYTATSDVWLVSLLPGAEDQPRFQRDLIRISPLTRRPPVPVSAGHWLAALEKQTRQTGFDDGMSEQPLMRLTKQNNFLIFVILMTFF